MIDLFRSFYNSVDVVTLVKSLVNNFGYATKDAETVMSVISTWGLKLNMIIISVVSGMMTSLIPNLTSSFVKKDFADVSKKINQTISIILALALPMAVGLSFVTPLVWKVFYGASTYGPITYRYLVFVAFATTLFTSFTTILQLLKEYKMVFISLIVGFLTKLVLNVPMMFLFDSMGIYPFYGAITATILGFVVSAMISAIYVSVKFKISYSETFREFKHIIIGVLLMLTSLFLLELVIPLNVGSRVLAFVFAMIYALVGGAVYIFYTYKSETLQHIFGQAFFDKILRKLRIKK